MNVETRFPVRRSFRVSAKAAEKLALLTKELEITQFELMTILLEDADPKDSNLIERANQLRNENKNANSQRKKLNSILSKLTAEQLEDLLKDRG